jgi:hypothetical protein
MSMTDLETFEHFKEKLTDALRENMCGDEVCQSRRVDAAILCLKGDVKHDEIAVKVLKDWKL